MILSSDDPMTPDQTRAAERGLLGAVMIMGRMPNVVLRPGDFTAKEHQALWKRFQDMEADGTALDMLTVWAGMRPSDLVTAGDYVYVVGLVDAAPVPDNIDHYAKLVKRASNERRFKIQRGAR